MLDKIFFNRIVKKSVVFCIVFVVAIAMATFNIHANNYNIVDFMSTGIIASPKIFDVFNKYVNITLKSEIVETTAEVAADNPKEIFIWDIAGDKSEFVYLPDVPLSEDLQKYTYEQCIDNQLDYSVVLALIWRESRFDFDAIGINANGTQDSGLMQINDVNLEWLEREIGITDIMDPVQNIKAGTSILGIFSKKHGMHNALFAYQYGEIGMLRKVESGDTVNDHVRILYDKSMYFKDMM